jgi:hypothetical protein
MVFLAQLHAQQFYVRERDCRGIFYFVRERDRHLRIHHLRGKAIVLPAMIWSGFSIPLSNKISLTMFVSPKKYKLMASKLSPG